MKYGNTWHLSLTLFLLCALLCYIPVEALASTTELTTGVPDSVSLHVEITGKGTATVGEERLSKTGTISVKRHQPFDIYLKPRSGYRITAVYLNGKSVLSSIKSEKLAIDELNLDGILSVTFSKVSSSTASKGDTSNPRTGDRQGTAVTVAALTAMISMVLLLLCKRRISRLNQCFGSHKTSG